MKELNDKIRELTDMLEDRKNAAKLLNTENMRLKKMCQDLQFQLLNKPQSRGESTAVKSMREMVRAGCFRCRESKWRMQRGYWGHTPTSLAPYDTVDNALHLRHSPSPATRFTQSVVLTACSARHRPTGQGLCQPRADDGRREGAASGGVRRPD